MIIDEPQKIGAPKSLEALSRFNALLVLRYSATHKVEHNKVHRLDALDAYNQKLVKKIAVRGITVKGLAGSTAYLYLDAIEVEKGANCPTARVELEVQTKGGRSSGRSSGRARARNLHDLAGGIEAYKGLFVTDVDANRDIIELSNGDVVVAGQLADRTSPRRPKRRIQIREVIRAHLDKERELFAQGIKVLSLFFIDEVAKYRDYDREDTLGDYARCSRRSTRLLVEDVPRRAGARRGDGGLPEVPAADDDAARRAPGLLLDRQEDQAARRRRRSTKTRRREGPVRRRRRLRPDPQGQGAAAVLRGAGAVHLLALGAARGLGQPERLRHGHAQEERQHRSRAARRSAAACGSPSTSTASGWTTPSPSTTSTS